MTLFDFQDDATIDARFAKWLEEVPDVWPLFVRLCDEVRTRGYQRYSADAISHRIRWHFNIEKRCGEFKMNDHFTSRLARKLIEEKPEYEGFFELRKLRSA